MERGRQRSSIWIAAAILGAQFVSAECTSQKNAVRGEQRTVAISKEQAVAIALRDARQAYRDIGNYDTVARLDRDGWHVEFRMRDDRLDGGGPKYLIDQKTGEITRKRYEQ